MYKEPFASTETNAAGALRVEHKMKEVAAKIVAQEQTDADFTRNLLNLCTLNRMAESYETNKVISEEGKLLKPCHFYSASRQSRSKARSKALLAALNTLTEHIGVYGKRVQFPLSIHWGNGIVLRDGTGMMLAAGTEHVAKWIAKHCEANKVISEEGK